ncbi:unnamed protein product [Soboliphyme baturini]|uniref:WD_REPEATS_REGION domain-containing protein n=1 Tax=Soboliphyme baturini TaxID=241478 RepID=A0A183II90_9BILA|nr:unnamed protein product [Soboliphyme baturini]
MTEPHIVAAPNEYRLNAPPDDGITAVHFQPEGTKLLMLSSWDGSVRLYELSGTSTNYLRTCGLDHYVKTYDFAHKTILGAHEAGVRCITYSPETSLVASGGWDGCVKVWDPRANRCSGCFNQPDKVYTIDACGDRLIVGTAGRKVWIWNLRNMGAGPEQKRDSTLKYQTRCIRSFPNKKAYALSSIEGRVAVEYVDPNPEVQRQKYAFKCHRLKDETSLQELIFPVNAIVFHPIHNTFATGGSDCIVNIWDPFNKKRLCQFHKYPTSISSLAFSSDGNYLAIAASYQYEYPEDPNPIPEPCVFIRKMVDQETKPKL